MMQPDTDLTPESAATERMIENIRAGKSVMYRMRVDGDAIPMTDSGAIVGNEITPLAAHDAEVARAAVEPWRKVVKGVLHLLDTYGGGPSGYDKVLREVRALLAHSEEGEPSKPFGDGTTPNRGGSSEFGR